MQKPKERQIADLVDYIRFPHEKNKREKVAYAGSRNFIHFEHYGQKSEMIGLAQESIYSRMPVTHWLFSWREDEQPTHEQVDDVVDTFLKNMKLEGHQVIYALHKDTENYHVHIAVNRMCEATGKVVQPHRGFDIEAAHKVVALLEHKHGWQSEDNSRYVVLENGELAKRRDVKKARKPSAKAAEFEHATGEKSAQRIAQERGHKIISEAKTWQELHEGMAQIGFRFEKKGSGAVVFVPSKNKAIAVKASSIDRNFSMGKLTKKLGAFVAGTYSQIPEQVAPEPVSKVNQEEWEEYQAKCADKALASTEEVDISEAEKAIAHAKKRHKQEQQNTINKFKSHGLHILNVARHFLSIQQKEELKTLRDNRKLKIKQKRNSARPHFETWLHSRQLHKQAALWRYRRELDKHQEVTPMETPQVLDSNITEAKAFERYAQAVNASRYRVTCIKMDKGGGKKTFILDKRDGVTKGFTTDEMLANIPTMLKLQARRENIYYTPLSDDKHHILIDDMTAENVARLRKDGFIPAVILESSPKNYQCILTIPRVQNSFSREASNRLTEQLNREYGDPKLSGCIHPHRAPGFGNMKPKHQNTDGSYPRVKLLFAEKQECIKAHLTARAIAKKYEEQERQKQTHPGPHQIRNLPTGSATAAYHTHYKDIRAHINIEDFSRLDAMIAVRMRATGHSPQAIMDAIAECAPAIRTKEGRNWQQYAERTANYAFGVAGDIALQRYEKHKEHWQRIEQKPKLTTRTILLTPKKIS